MNNEGVAARHSSMASEVGYALGSGVTIMQELITLLEQAEAPSSKSSKFLVEPTSLEDKLAWKEDLRARIKQAEIWIRDVDGDR